MISTVHVYRTSRSPDPPTRGSTSWMDGTVRSSSAALSTFIYARTRIFEGNLYRVDKVPCEGDQISHHSTSGSKLPFCTTKLKWIVNPWSS